MDKLIIALLPLLIQVESGGNNAAIGDNGNAVGCLQMWKICVDDVNRISGKHYTYKDRYDRQKSLEMAQIYLTHYGKHYEKKTGHKANMEVLARLFNGGPAGYKKKSTIKYWKKVERLVK